MSDTAKSGHSTTDPPQLSHESIIKIYIEIFRKVGGATRILNRLVPRDRPNSPSFFIVKNIDLMGAFDPTESSSRIGIDRTVMCEPRHAVTIDPVTHKKGGECRDCVLWDSLNDILDMYELSIDKVSYNTCYLLALPFRWNGERRIMVVIAPKDTNLPPDFYGDPDVAEAYQNARTSANR